MPRSYWLLYVALGVGLAIASPALAQTDSEQRGQDQSAPGDGHGEQAPADDAAGVAPAGEVEAAPQNPPTGSKATEGESENGDYDCFRGRLGAWSCTGSDTAAQWLMAFLGALATFLSAIAVFLLYRTLKATRDAVEQARDGTEVAETAAKAASDANKLFEWSAQRQLRAYLQVMNLSYDQIARPGGGNATLIEVIIENTGQTPARDIRAGISVAIIAKKDVGDITFKAPVLEHEAPIGSGQYFHLKEIVDHPFIDDLDDNLILCIWGKVIYYDVFASKRQTPFRFWFNQRARDFRTSDKGNHTT